MSRQLFNKKVTVDGTDVLCGERRMTMPIVTKEGYLLPPERIFIMPADTTVTEGSKVTVDSDILVVQSVIPITNHRGLTVMKEVHCRR